MSLLVFGSSNKIAHGVIRKLYNSGNFEKIVCADIYPGYASIQRFLNFKNELGVGNSNTKLTDIKIIDKPDLDEAINKATHVVYITHDYYTLTASKLNLLKTTAESAKKNKKLKGLVALTPIEHDHQGESSPIEAAKASEADAAKANSGLVHLKADLTFGPDSTIANSILTRAINGMGLAYSIPAQPVSAHPIHTDDIASIVEVALNGESYKGKSYLLQGPDSVNLGDYIKTLCAHAGEGVNLTHSLMERILSPSHANVLSQRLYDPSYINLVKLLANYQPLAKHSTESAHSFNVPLQHFKDAYPARSVNKQNYVNEDSSLEKMVKNYLY